MSARNSPQIRWTFRRYRNISAFNRMRVFVHSPMSIKFSASRKINDPGNISSAFLEEMDCFPIFRTSLAVTETFLALSNLSSQGPGRYVAYYLPVNIVTNKN